MQVADDFPLNLGQNGVGVQMFADVLLAFLSFNQILVKSFWQSRRPRLLSVGLAIQIAQLVLQTTVVLQAKCFRYL